MDRDMTTFFELRALHEREFKVAGIGDSLEDIAGKLGLK